MKFQKHVKQEVRELLAHQLKEYEQDFTMTKEERKQLHNWVASGHSPYDNGDYIYGAGIPLDFISALRAIQEEEKKFSNLSEEEKQSEIASVCYQYDTLLDEISFEADSFCQFSGELDEELPF